MNRSLSTTDDQTPLSGVPDGRLLLSVKEVSHALGLSVRTIWRLVSEGELASPRRVGRAARWRRCDVVEFAMGTSDVETQA